MKDKLREIQELSKKAYQSTSITQSHLYLSEILTIIQSIKRSSSSDPSQSQLKGILMDLLNTLVKRPDTRYTAPNKKGCLGWMLCRR
jgi:hypothetical protein